VAPLIQILQILLGPGDALAKATLLVTIFGSGPAPASRTAVLGPLEPILFHFMKQTDLGLTADNPVVIGAWGTVLAMADAFFVLLVILGLFRSCSPIRLVPSRFR
jgi:hypothetical protein